MNQENSSTENTALNPETWVDHYGDYLYCFAISRVRDPSVAEDLVQETFLAALNSIKSFASRSSPKTWLTGILKHKIVDYFRRKSREPTGDDVETAMKALEALFDEKGQWKIKPAEWTADPEKLYGQKEFMDVLNRCLSELSSRLAHIFILREMDGLKTDEICKVLSITATNCWVMLYRARMYLRQCLESNWFKPDSS
jgi:RNA polymerase sigma-70 factor (TIGR02943 family)